MKLIHCETTAFIASSVLELVLEDGLAIEVRDLCGEAFDGDLTLRKCEETDEIVYPVTDGTCTLLSAALEVGSEYKVCLVCGDRRVSAGAIKVLNEAVLGKCVYALRDDENHIWRVCMALVDLLRDMRQKLDNHVDGTEVI